MAWTAPFTAVAGSVLTAAQLNTFVRDNLRETMPARATRPGSLFVATGPHTISERTAARASDDGGADITTTSFGDPSTGEPGPAVTVFTGTAALVGYRALVRISSASARIETAFAVSGATDIEATNSRSVGYSVSNSASGLQQRMGALDLVTELNPGLNTFTLQYNVSTGSGFVNGRRIWVQPL